MRRQAPQTCYGVGLMSTNELNRGRAAIPLEQEGLADTTASPVTVEAMRQRLSGPTTNETVERPLPAPCVVDAALPPLTARPDDVTSMASFKF